LFDQAREEVETEIMASLGGLTKIRVIEPWGRTITWPDEQSTLLAAISESNKADPSF
jgi:hypothetical protein